ncbi:hypothetical protein B4U80_13555 [Leptotrombidium deliense]|uniref:Ganglioside GM2 activator-like protein n=1 Tax=Leptotrombidium deliense TaxID=299467 RepID=A0A443S4J7_9ACAR|nr:hypothetical protein B4U80_13555 [Leptotrombidium deliense]
MFRVILCFICISFAYAVKWKDCGGNRSLVHFHTLSINPEKVRFGDKVTASTGLTVDRNIIGETLSNLQIWRIFRIFGYDVTLKIGCYYGYGSCLRKLSEVVHDNKVMCGWYETAMNGTCKNFTGNIMAGNFSTENVQTTFPDVKGITAILLGVRTLSRQMGMVTE